MKRYSESHWCGLVLAILSVVALLAFTGCDDDPATPPPAEEPEVFLATTPDSLVALFQRALVEQNDDIFAALLSDNYRHMINTRVTDEYGLTSTWLNRAETIRSAEAMFGGGAVDNILGEIAPGAGPIQIAQFEQTTDWVDSAFFPTQTAARFRTRILIGDAGGGSATEFNGEMDFYVYPVDTTLADGTEVQRYFLIKLMEESVDQTPESYWATMLSSYLAPEDPTPVLAVIDDGEFPYARVACDAGGSAAPLHGLHTAPFRFFVESDQSWTTEWLGSATQVLMLQAPGTETVQLEVRDRWGHSAITSVQVVTEIPDPPLATTPEILMQNFRKCQEGLLIDPLTELLHPDFKMPLLPEIYDEWGWNPTFYFDSAIMAGIHQNIFSGQSGRDSHGNVIPPIDQIVVNLFELQGVWEEIEVEDPAFGDVDGVSANYFIELDYWNADMSYRLVVNGMVQFYAVAVDVDGESVYQLIGARSLSSGLKTDRIYWDRMLSLYR
jgi:hypothetical protein